uniref:Uncharacterized protein n=1 Tax=Chionoecetes opilio bacilliform virus TaxID=1825681 RepID=A0A1Q3DLG7_9VIRU|nr:hypothetical protein SCV_049 [Chionoecetes opilio bacilliform virus]
MSLEKKETVEGYGKNNEEKVSKRMVRYYLMKATQSLGYCSFIVTPAMVRNTYYVVNTGRRR